MKIEELFVSYEIALKLKKKGFDEDCLGWYYTYKRNLPTLSYGHVAVTALVGSAILAPLYQQVINWFREKHNIHISIGTVYDDFDGEWSFAIQQNHKGIVVSFRTHLANSYYEALNKAIEEAFNLI